MAVALVGVLALTLAPAPAAGQIGQLRLSGSIEEDVVYDTLRTGETITRSFTLGSRYAPILEGFLLDPRLLTFSYAGSFTDRRTDATTGDTQAQTLEPYRLNVDVFPFGLHTFTLRAARSASDFDFEQGRQSLVIDSYGGRWAYRGGRRTPEAWLDFNREVVEERRLEGGLEERTRSTLGLQLRKEFERFRPTFNYTAELTEREGTVPTVSFVQADGLKHRFQLDDRIRIGERGVLTPLLEYTVAPDQRDGQGSLTLTGPLSQTVDGSAALRYSLFERFEREESGARPVPATHVASAQGQLTKRFTDDFVLTTTTNASWVTGGEGGDAWSTGGILAFRAAPFRHLRGTTDYGLQVSSSDRGTIVSHRGHVSAVSTVLPRHTFTGDYFVALTEGDPLATFRSQTVRLAAVSQAVPRAIVSSGYLFEFQQGLGERERHEAHVKAEVLALPAVLPRAGIEYVTEKAAGGGQQAREEQSVIGDAGVTVRAPSWLELSATGRYGVREVDREDRQGQFAVSGATVAAAVTRGRLFARVEGFTERDASVGQLRQGVRGLLSWRFRVWTITADAEFSRFELEGIDIGRERFMLRISRPLNFSFP